MDRDSIAAAKANASNALSFISQTFQSINSAILILIVVVEMDRRFATAPTHRLPAAAAPASRSRRTSSSLAAAAA